ncbi:MULTISPECIES: hypothetical protein [Streptosporangium]|uniref:Uncharacterized protein n=1 Tax=Streptosporangium brasiliense TaxID=47480 RepID=A0ABT9R2J7_9ACTN|nr:hypothetical protein [Streptosporangium brasiliense]MDP9863457.1 hypothetical protein [Streptosporangium brasiliense]
MLRIDDLPAGVSELAGADLDTVAGLDVVLDDGISAGMNPGTGYVSTSYNNGKSTDTLPADR